MKIVLVDDEQWIVTGLSKIIAKRYPEAVITSFTDPQTALDSIAQACPDLLITDIHMPGMSGMELIDRVRTLGLRYYAVLTGLDDVYLLQQGIRAQVIDYLIKPANKAELFALIERVRSRQAEAEHAGIGVAAPESDGIAALATLIADGAAPAFEAQLRGCVEEAPLPDVLDRAARAAGRQLAFWEACSLAEAFAAGTMTPEGLLECLRVLSARLEPKSPEVRTALQLIEKHYAQPLTLAQVASDVFLQANYFSTLFKRETGLGFVNFLNQYRVDKACRILFAEPNAAVEEIALQTGFPSTRHFFATFKRYTGLTPGGFRDLLAGFTAG